MTVASDEPPGRHARRPGPREEQRTLPAGVSGATGHVSRGQSNRSGAVLARKRSRDDLSAPEMGGVFLRLFVDLTSVCAGERGRVK